MDSLGPHRIAFNNSLVAFWDQLERDIGPKLQQWEHAQGRLAALQRTADEQEKTIQGLVSELQEARKQTSDLRGTTSAPVEQRLRTVTNDRPCESGVSATRCLRTFTRSISPPPKVLGSSLSVARGIQTEDTEPDAVHLSGTRPHELAKECSKLRKEVAIYKDALRVLQTKYSETKRNFQAWIDQNAARQMLKKRRHGEDRPATTSPIYKTPETSGSSSSIVLTTSPVKPVIRQKSPTMRLLFSEHPYANRGNTSDANVKPVDGMLAHGQTWSQGLPPSVPGMQVQKKHIPIATACFESEETQNSDDEKLGASHIQDHLSNRGPSEEPDLPPICNNAIGSPDSPVVIKSEPRSSGSDGPGWRDFAQDSLDLDDIGDRPERKRRKLHDARQRRFQVVPNKGHLEMLPLGREEDLQPVPKLPAQLTTEAIESADRQPTISNDTLVDQLKSVEPSSRRLTKGRGRRGLRGAAIGALADGTDGHSGIGGQLVVRDIRTKIDLGQVLSTPVRDPSLKALPSSETNSRSAPAKRHTPEQKRAPTTAQTDPLPKSKPFAPPRKRNRELDVTDFRVNPNTNEGRDFAFQDTVRNREARKCLPACIKACCRDIAGFAEAAGVPQEPLGPKWRSSSLEADDGEDHANRLLNRFGRHREAFPRRHTPPGFWDAGFPDTQKAVEYQEQAEQLRLLKVQERQREAEKGDKGRYMYKPA